jgi:ATP-dependent Clp protease ATP-binding subunit ClpA
MLDLFQKLEQQAEKRARESIDPLSEEGKSLALQEEAKQLLQSANQSVVDLSNNIAQMHKDMTQKINQLNSVDNLVIDPSLSAEQQIQTLQNYLKLLDNSELSKADQQAIADNLLAQYNKNIESLLASDKQTVTDIVTSIKKENKGKFSTEAQPEFISNVIAENLTSTSTQQAVDKKENTEPEAKLLTRSKIAHLEATLKKNVFGQNEVIEEVTNVLKTAVVNLKVNKDKPAGSFFFAGPSGVGKTELALAIAEALGVPVLKLNMGEYALEQEAAKLLGAPPGYAGYEEGGRISNFIEANPLCIILFDEYEKAHHSIDNILLSIMDKGICQDNKGKDVKFKQTIIIGTSNLGGKVEYIPNLTQEEKNEYRMEAIKEKLRPEIIGRYDGIFHFHPLSFDVYCQIITKFLNNISKAAKEEHGMNLSFSPSIVELIAKRSNDPALGGRPAGKFIEKIITIPLANFLIADDYEQKIIDNPEIQMDINEKGNIYFRGNNDIVLGELENTEDAIVRLEKTRFSGKANSQNSQDMNVQNPDVSKSMTSEELIRRIDEMEHNLVTAEAEKNKNAATPRAPRKSPNRTKNKP